MHLRRRGIHRPFAAAEPAIVPIFGDPLAVEESDGQRTVLAKFDVDADQGWDWRKIAAPFTDDDLSSTKKFRSWLRNYLDVEVREAGKGNVTGPRKAALDVLRDLRNEVRLAVDHGGLDGTSYRDELDQWYTPLNAYLSIGPPAPGSRRWPRSSTRASCRRSALACA